MLPYTDAERNVIKSNLHVGDNRPLASVVITGQPYPMRIKSISIEPLKNGAGQAKIVIDNKDGIYSPDGVGEWNHVLWPNNDLTISLGYGTNIKQVFAGLIDNIQMKTYPQEITVFSRDFLKRALDQTVTENDGSHSIVYLMETIEHIFTDLALRAGWQESEIICNSSGPIISDITFTNISYADAMKQLADNYNYEFYAGRYGEIYFQYAVDRQPEVVDEVTTLTGATEIELLKFPIVTGSIRVNSNTLVSGTIYVEGVDYTIVSGNKNTKWKIKRTPTSNIASGQTVYVSYVYAAWVFEEGVDIISLGYTIDDTDLYRAVTVIGQTSEDKVCNGIAVYENADFYNIFQEKILITEEKSAPNAETCANIANYKALTMATNAREMEFEAVGNPYLWVGDCIMIIESSTALTAIYRITSLSHSYGPKGQPIFSTSITAKYYGYIQGG